MNGKHGDTSYPEHIRGLSVEAQLAILYERVSNLSDLVHTLRNALITASLSLIGGALLLLFSVSVGWIGPHSARGALQLFRGLL